MTPCKAIRAKCLDCCADNPREVKLCVSKDCSLYPYRMGEQPARKGVGGNPNFKRKNAYSSRHDWGKNGYSVASLDKNIKPCVIEGKLHVLDEICWCEPWIAYEDPSGARVWVHGKQKTWAGNAWKRKFLSKSSMNVLVVLLKQWKKHLCVLTAGSDFSRKRA